MGRIQPWAVFTETRGMRDLERQGSIKGHSKGEQGDVRSVVSAGRPAVARLSRGFLELLALVRACVCECVCMGGGGGGGGSTLGSSVCVCVERGGAKTYIHIAQHE